MTKPMLAVPLAKADIAYWNEWAMEEKFDGHRLIVQVSDFDVTAWTRPRRRKDGAKTMERRTLPPHLVTAFRQLPIGTYDGELLGGVTSTDVTRTDLVGTLRFVVFDLLGLKAHSTLSLTYDQRRELLELMWSKNLKRGTLVAPHLELARSFRVERRADIDRFVKRIWDQGGEGAILKRRASVYHEGKRSPDWVKLKKLCTEVCRVVGFEAGRGEKVDRGPFASVAVESTGEVWLESKGRLTTVKTVNDAELDHFNAEWHSATKGRALAGLAGYAEHPAIGRLLRIEFQDFTPGGDFRHPRWDRWEDE